MIPEKQVVGIVADRNSCVEINMSGADNGGSINMGLLFKQPIHNLSSYFRLLTSATSRPLRDISSFNGMATLVQFLLFGRCSLNSARPFSAGVSRKQRCAFGSVSRFFKARIIFDPGASLFTL